MKYPIVIYRPFGESRRHQLRLHPASGHAQFKTIRPSGLTPGPWRDTDVDCPMVENPWTGEQRRADEVVSDGWRYTFVPQELFGTNQPSHKQIKAFLADLQRDDDTARFSAACDWLRSCVPIDILVGLPIIERPGVTLTKNGWHWSCGLRTIRNYWLPANQPA